MSERFTLRVASYNIHHGQGTDGKFDYKRQADLITSLNPDVVALQEVDRRTRRSSGIDQAMKLAELTEMRHVYGRAMYYDGGEYGEAILSKFPLSDARAYPLPYRFGQEPRAALASRVAPPDGPAFLFVATHLCHQSNATRMEQVNRIKQLFGDSGKPPVVLAGDLNARPGSEPMALLLDEQWRGAIDSESQIDYVLTRRSDPWRSIDSSIVNDEVASDHPAVLAVLEWRGSA